jgi:hypothetical protein
MDSLDQNALNIPITKASSEGQELTIDVKSVRGFYTGTLSEDGSEIEGKWQRGRSSFLVLADHLTRKEIDVLRYDDRGAGASTDRFSKTLVATSLPMPWQC